MPSPTPEQITNLGPPCEPFERKAFSRNVLLGEDIVFLDQIIDATDGIDFKKVAKLSQDAILEFRPLSTKYLWVIDDKGLKLILESTKNPDAERGCVCHTNITGGDPALQGGELWFGTDEKVYINNSSGRYGATTLIQRKAVLAYFQSIGFDVIQLPNKY
jgi:hypothetical protein